MSGIAGRLAVPVTVLLIVLGGTFAAPARADTLAGQPASEAQGGAPSAEAVPDSVALERRLQALSWPQFRAVVEAVPKLRRSVDAYGPFGWEYVRMNYRSYRWRKSIDRLDDAQKAELAALVARAELGTEGERARPGG